MATVTGNKKRAAKLTGSQLFDIVGELVGLKKKVVRDTLYALSDVVVTQLTKNGEVRIPHLGKFVTKFTPSKKIPAGNYPNNFKRDADGRPVMEYKEARVRPERTKLKFIVASNVRKPVLNK